MAVLEQCSLLEDLEVLAEGDMTEVGAGGITLVSRFWIAIKLIIRAEAKKPVSVSLGVFTLELKRYYSTISSPLLMLTPLKLSFLPVSIISCALNAR